MDTQMFQKHAKRTMDFELDEVAQLANVGFGLYGESGELLKLCREYPSPENKEKITDEGGDLFWYIANTCTVLGIEFTDLFPYRIEVKSVPIQLLMNVFEYGSEVGDLFKKHIGQKHIMDIEKVVFNLGKMVENLCGLLKMYEISVKECLEYNQIKLMKRYPNGFEAARSINREV